MNMFIMPSLPPLAMGKKNTEICVYIYISNPYIVHPQKTPHHPSHLDLHQKLPSAPQVDHSNQDDSDRFRLKASLYRISVASINGYTHFICIGNTLYIWYIYIHIYHIMHISI